MTANIFQDVKSSLQPKLAQIVADLLPGGRLHGKEYSCASLEGGEGNSCKTDIETGIGSDFATGETWSDIIALERKLADLHSQLKEQKEKYTASKGRNFIRFDRAVLGNLRLDRV